MREDGTPYYIGKGRGQRAFRKERAIPMPPKERILFLKKNLTEAEAFQHEIYLIAVLGRKDLGTGILRNLTNGGEGTSGCRASEKTREKFRARKGWKHSKETREKIRQAALGRTHSRETREKLSHSHTGRVVPQETKEKLRQAALRQWERKRMEKG